ncbi:MAG: hypothetical protein ABIZ04_20940 [Opitutus sp.]
MKIPHIIILALAFIACAPAQAQLLARPANPPSNWSSTSLSWQWYKYALQESSLKTQAYATIATRDATINALNAQLAGATGSLADIQAKLTAISVQNASTVYAANIVLWKDNSTDEDGFKVERTADDGTTWKTMATLSPNAELWVDFTIAPGTFGYRVRAFRGAFDSLVVSPPSNITIKTQFKR